MNVLISWVLVVILVTAGIGVVTLATAPVLEQAQASASLNQAEQTLTQLSNIIKTVSREGIGSSRVITIPNLQQGTWQLIPEEEIIEFRLSTSPLEQAIRRIRDGLVYISGFDADCSSGTYAGKEAWIMKNSHIKVYLQRANGTLNTANNILAISSVTGKTIEPTDSSVLIDGEQSSATGSGYSTMRTGSGMPECVVHFFVNSATVKYNIFYTLYSASDFIVIEIKNIEAQEMFVS